MQNQPQSINFNRTTSLHKTIRLSWAIIWLALAPACGNGPPNPATPAPPEPANASTTTATPVTTAPTNQLTLPATPPVHGSPAPLSTQAPAPLPSTPTPLSTQAPNPVILEIAEGTTARYLVKEQFARRDFPNDAVGETSEVSGSISFRPDGSVDQSGSSFRVQLRRLRSEHN